MSTRYVWIMGVMICFGLSESSQAFDAAKCSKLLNGGFYKTYKYQGIDAPSSKATKDHGSTQGSSEVSTESSTAVLDPGHWSKYSTYGVQSTSSWGECSLLGLQKLREERELYFVQNKDEILREVARGRGEHLRVLATYTLCQDQSYEAFGVSLQKAMSELLHVESLPRPQFGRVIDGQVRTHENLKANCHDFGA